MGARLQLVEEHVRQENQHDLEGIMHTFGAAARYDDEPWALHYSGRDEVRGFYQGLLQALPDLRIDIQSRHVGETAVVLEVVIHGTHLGLWRSLPATGAQLQFPLCGIFTFDAAGQLAGERIYYDRGTVLHQLGLFHEPESALGGLTIALTHPLTMGRIAKRAIFGR
jgi:steroid delta-isomerase-like uncharacterized protein